MSTYIYGVCYTILFIILCKMFLEGFVKKVYYKSKVFNFVTIVILTAFLYVVSMFLADNFVWKEIFVIFLCALFMWIYFRQKFTRILALVLLYQGIALVVDYATIIVMSGCFPGITINRLSDPAINIILGVLSQTLLFCIIMFVNSHSVQKSSEVLTSLEWIRFSVFPVFTIIVLIALLREYEIPQSSSQKTTLTCVSFGLLVMNIIIFYLINDILKREVQIRETRVMLEKVKNETEHYNRQRKREHEYKNQMAVITALVNEHKLEELKHYLNVHNDEIIEKLDFVDTNNSIVNTIITLKYQEARRKGIAFILKINDLSDLKVKDEDIVLILSNLLNNAIEACEACEDGVIKLKIVSQMNHTIISVINTLSIQPISMNNKLLTTKNTDIEMHGIGIENVKETVEKYGGSCVIKYNNDSFKFVILIPR